MWVGAPPDEGIGEVAAPMSEDRGQAGSLSYGWGGTERDGAKVEFAECQDPLMKGGELWYAVELGLGQNRNNPLELVVEVRGKYQGPRWFSRRPRPVGKGQVTGDKAHSWRPVCRTFEVLPQFVIPGQPHKP